MARSSPEPSSCDPFIAAHLNDFIAIRHDLHRHPELAFKEVRTAGVVARYLTAWGYEVSEGVGGTGIVGTLRRGNGPKSLAIRADMDALPIHEETGLPYASTTPQVMHACGHDGHTTILLAAAHGLAASSDFRGTLHVVFQPAEEIGAGAKAMIRDGLFERFPADAVFGLHNWPGVPAGHFAFVKGPAMASVDRVKIRVLGRGGHGAMPQEAVDPVVASAHIITALQTVVSRNVDPLDAAVVTIGSIHGGKASNVIPDSVEMVATIRAFRPEIRALLERRIPILARAQAESFGASADVDYSLGFPSVINHTEETDFAEDVARDVFGDTRIVEGFRPRTASEDFAFYLSERPGSFVFVGHGGDTALHSPHYDFNDAIIGPAATFWLRLAERYLS